MNTKEYNVVFILSTGRSGSTLLDMLLGAHPQLCPLGEIHYLQGGLELGRFCGCGMPLKDCKFWQSVLEKNDITKYEYPIHYFQLPKSRKKLLRLRWIVSIFLGIEFKVDKSARRAYVESNKIFLDAVSETLVNRNKIVVLADIE